MILDRLTRSRRLAPLIPTLARGAFWIRRKGADD
jgi:hypothetical protein